MAAVGIARDECLIANVFRYRPPDNKIGHFFASRRKAESEDDPLDESLGKMGAEFCRARFAGEIQALAEALCQARPGVIVALGRTPLWALTGLNGVTALRGQVLTGRLCPAPVIASFVARRNSVGPETEATFRADLAMARSIANQPSLEAP